MICINRSKLLLLVVLFLFLQAGLYAGSGYISMSRDHHRELMTEFQKLKIVILNYELLTENLTLRIDDLQQNLTDLESSHEKLKIISSKQGQLLIRSGNIIGQQRVQLTELKASLIFIEKQNKILRYSLIIAIPTSFIVGLAIPIVIIVSTK